MIYTALTMKYGSNTIVVTTMGYGYGTTVTVKMVVMTMEYGSVTIVAMKAMTSACTRARTSSASKIII